MHYRCDGRNVARGEEARSDRADEEIFRCHDVDEDVADKCVAGDAAGVHTPGREAVRKLQCNPRPAGLISYDGRIPIGRIGELGADLDWRKAASSTAEPIEGGRPQPNLSADS